MKNVRILKFVAAFACTLAVFASGQDTQSEDMQPCDNCTSAGAGCEKKQQLVRICTAGTHACANYTGPCNSQSPAQYGTCKGEIGSFSCK
jgi:hypothetical protein